MRLISSLVCVGISTSALALKLPNQTPKDPNFKPAASHLSNQDDFKGQEEAYKNIAVEIRENPERINSIAHEMVEDEPFSQRPALEEYVQGELKKEALARQYVLLIDKSASMQSYDSDGGYRKDRWGAAEIACKGLVKAMFENDMDHKIPTYLFGHKVETIGELTNENQVMELFSQHEPDGRNTNLSDALETALNEHIGSVRNNYEVVPGTTVVVITDGAPNYRERVKNVIKRYADPSNGFIKNDTELAISFIQLGDDSGATSFLEEMDKGWYFNSNKMDICDTKKDDSLRRLGAAKILEDAIFD